MKAILAGLALAFLLSPAFALADDATPAAPAPPSPPSQAQRQAMRQMHQQAFAQMRQMHAQERTQALAALTPAHRQLLASLVGQLAISSNPDPEAAASKLNASLSPAEAKAVLSIHQNFRDQMTAMHKKMMAQMQAQMPADARARMEAHQSQMNAQPGGMGLGAGSRAPGTKRPADAGHYLLRLAHGGPGGPGMMGGPGMGGPRGRMGRPHDMGGPGRP